MSLLIQKRPTYLKIVNGKQFEEERISLQELSSKLVLIGSLGKLGGKVGER